MKNLSDNLDLFDTYLQDKRKFFIEPSSGNYDRCYYQNKITYKFNNIKNNDNFRNTIKNFINDYVPEIYRTKHMKYQEYFLYIDTGNITKLLFQFIENNNFVIVLTLLIYGGYDIFKLTYDEVDLFLSHLSDFNVLDKLKLKEKINNRIYEEINFPNGVRLF